MDFVGFFVFWGTDGKLPLKNTDLMSRTVYMKSKASYVSHSFENLGCTRPVFHLASWLWLFKGKCKNPHSGWIWNNTAWGGSFHSKPLVIKGQGIFSIIKAPLLFKSAFVVNPIQNIVCGNPYPYKRPIFSEIQAKHLSPAMFTFNVIALQFHQVYMCVWIM